MNIITALYSPLERHPSLMRALQIMFGVAFLTTSISVVIVAALMARNIPNATFLSNTVYLLPYWVLPSGAALFMLAGIEYMKDSQDNRERERLLSLRTTATQSIETHDMRLYTARPALIHSRPAHTAISITPIQEKQSAPHAIPKPVLGRRLSP